LPAVQHVRDVDIRPGQPDAFEQTVEQLPGLTHERNALLILVKARRFPDEHQIGVGVPVPEDDLGAPLVQPAARARRGLRPERVEHRGRV
jgi:hypothetical protein